MKNLFAIVMVITLLPMTSWAQEFGPAGYYIDALRFSQTNTGGSARIQALGGSNVALGAEITSASSNPAGLGLYNKSEFSLTPGFTYTANKSTLYGSEVVNHSIFDRLSNIGLVINNTNNNESGWYGGSFGFSVNKINDFDNKIEYSSINNQNSIIDHFIASANGSSANKFAALSEATDITTLAYYTYLIGPWNVIDANNPDDEYFSDITLDLKPSLRQKELIETSGSQYQWSFSYGGNFSDIVYVGFGVSVVSLNYYALTSYSESEFDYSADDASYDPIYHINLDEDLTIKGAGINNTFGIIIRPVSFIRLGASITSPTFYHLTDTYNATLAADWNNFLYQDIIGGDTVLNYLEASTRKLVSRYNLSTPLKATVGIAVFLGKMGFITADLEYLDYKSTWLNSSNFSMAADNDFIKNNYSSAYNLKTGVEIRLDNLRLRAGYAINHTPSLTNLNYKGLNQKISAGAGWYNKQFFADFTVVNSYLKDIYSPYTLSDGSQPNVDLRKTSFSGIATVGIKF